MATELKRITISMPDDVAAAVEALAQAQGVPQSKAVISVLVDFAPAMLALAKFMDQMKAGQKQAAKQTIQHLMGDAMAEVIGQQLDMYPPKKGASK